MLNNPYSLNIGQPFSHPLEISSQNASINSETQTSPIYQQFKETFSPSPPSLPTEKKRLNSEVIHKGEMQTEEGNTEKIVTQVRQLKSEVGRVEKNLEKIKSKSESSSSMAGTLEIVQWWVADVVLKGGSMVTQSGLPFILNTTSEALPGLDPATESIKVATDILDIGSGLAGSIYRARMLEAAEKEVFKLKRLSKALSPEQRARLEQLEKSIKHARSLLPSQTKEQFLRFGRNILSYMSFTLSWFRDVQILSSLTSTLQAFIGGFNAALYGLFFYRAHQDLQAHRSWSKDFKTWVRERTLFISQNNLNTPEATKHIQETAAKIDEKRTDRYRQRLEDIALVKEKIATKEMDIETIHSKIKAVEHEGLQRFVENLKSEKPEIPESPKESLSTFKKRLETKLGITFEKNDPVVQSLYAAALELSKIKSDKKLFSQDKQIAIEKVRKSIAKDIDACCERRIAHLSKDSLDPLLTAYVDYQSILDPTIKNSLIEMVQKKHKIEKSFLKFKRSHLGIQFSVSTLIFGVALTLAIIGLVTTPIGIGALILGILAISSVAISLGLAGRAYYLSYQQKPALTAATLKGAYLRIYAYQAGAKIHSMAENMANSIQKSWQVKRNRVANAIDKLPVIHRLFARRVKGDEIELQDISTLKQRDDIDSPEMSKAQKLKDKAIALQNELEELTWKDFANQAKLKVASKSTQQSQSFSYDSFDTLEALNHAINQVDFNLLSPDTKELIEQQLGIDIHALQIQVERDPTTFKQLLRNFFNLDDIGLVKFVGEQRFR